MALYQHCYVYLHGHEFGGTNPAMLKAMSNHCAILALDTPFNREMLNQGEFGMFFSHSSADVAKHLNAIEAGEASLTELRANVKYGLGQKYNWDAICQQYIAEFIRLKKSDR